MPATPVHIIKPTFAGGEFAPSLYSRVDLQRFQTGCKTLRNFYVHPHGGASNRPGFQYIASTKTEAKKARVVGFEYSIEQAYILEFGEYYIRFYMDGGQIVAPGTTAAWGSGVVYHIGDFVVVSAVVYRSKTDHTSNGTTHNTPPGNATDWEASNIYEIATPWDENDLVDLQFTQSADVLYVAHPDFCTRAISRYSHTYWDITYFPFVNGPFQLPNTTATTITPSAVSGTGITLTASTSIFAATNVGSLYKLEHYIAGQSQTEAFTGVANGTGIKCGAGASWRIISHGTWTGKIRVEKSNDGGTTWYAVRSFSSANDNNINTYGAETDEDAPFLVRVACYGYSSGTINVDLTTDGFWQTGIAKVTAYTSGTAVTADVLTEIGAAAATKYWSEGSWSPRRGFPATLTFYQDRFAFACTEKEPQTTWLSKSSNYIDFGRSEPLLDDDGVTENLPSRKMNAIRHLVPVGEMLALTSGGEWSISPGQSGVLTPTSKVQKQQGERGSSKVRPVVIGNRVIYVQPMGTVVRDLVYDDSSASYTGDPLSILSNHLFQNHTIVDMAYAQEPDSIVWMVRDDGVLLSLTYLREQEMVAWTWHDTQGTVESIATIPGDGYNEVWILVKRGTHRYIERLKPRMVSIDIKDQFFLDSGISYDNPVDITGISKAAQGVVTAADHGFINGDLVDIEGVEGVLDAEGVSVVNDLRFEVSDKTTHTFKLKDPDDGTYIDTSAATAYTELGHARKAATVITGLTHLEGMTVKILADGSVIDDQVVTGGSITLTIPASRVHVGLGYYSDLEPLDIEVQQPDGTLQGRMSRISGIKIRFLQSSGGLIGPNEDHLDEIVQRTDEPAGSPEELQSGFHVQPISGDYTAGPPFLFRQEDPLPVTILALIPILTIGG